MSSPEREPFDHPGEEWGTIQNRLEMSLAAISGDVELRGPGNLYAEGARLIGSMHTAIREFVTSYNLPPNSGQPPDSLHAIAAYAERGLVIGALVYREAVGADQFALRSHAEELYLHADVEARKNHPNIAMTINDHLEQTGSPMRQTLAEGDFRALVELRGLEYEGLPVQELELYGNGVGYMVRAAFVALQEDALRQRQTLTLTDRQDMETQIAYWGKQWLDDLQVRKLNIDGQPPSQPE